MQNNLLNRKQKLFYKGNRNIFLKIQFYEEFKSQALLFSYTKIMAAFLRDIINGL